MQVAMTRHMWTAMICGLLTLLLASGVLQLEEVSAQPAPRAPAAKVPVVPAKVFSFPSIDTWKLDNGLTVAFMHVERAPMVAVAVWYHAGSKDEARDRRGTAHMFEHLMFDGSQHVPPDEHARHIDRLGGYTRATVLEDASFFTNVLPNEYLDFACRLEAERMRSLLFRPDAIAAERSLLERELRNGGGNPLVRGFWRFLAVAYSKHPYAWTASGVPGDLAAITPADLQRFYDTYYTPQNALLVVVGDVTKEQVETSARTWFAAIPGGAAAPRPSAGSAEPAQTEKRRLVVEPGGLGLVISGFHVPAARSDDIHALQVASLILGAGETSRLHRRLVTTDQTAVQAGSSILVREDPGLLTLYGAYTDPALGGKVEAALADEVKKLETTLVTPRELTRAKNQIISSIMGSLTGVAGQAEQIGLAWIQAGDVAAWQSNVARLQAVTAADIQRVVRQYCNDSNLTTVVIPPRGER